MTVVSETENEIFSGQLLVATPGDPAKTRPHRTRGACSQVYEGGEGSSVGATAESRREYWVTASTAAPSETMAPPRIIPPMTSVKTCGSLYTETKATKRTPATTGAASATFTARLRPTPRHTAIMLSSTAPTVGLDEVADAFDAAAVPTASDGGRPGTEWPLTWCF